MATDMEYLQQRIGEWHVKTFGQSDDMIQRLRGKFREEAKELLESSLNGPDNDEEIADCIIVLLALAHRRGIPADACVWKKFREVESRGIEQQRIRDERRDRREASTL